MNFVICYVTACVCVMVSVNDNQIFIVQVNILRYVLWDLSYAAPCRNV